MTNETCSSHCYDEDGICYNCGGDFGMEIAQLEADNAALKEENERLEALNKRIEEAFTYSENVRRSFMVKNEQLEADNALLELEVKALGILLSHLVDVETERDKLRAWARDA